jgi:hypothetical protein
MRGKSSYYKEWHTLNKYCHQMLFVFGYTKVIINAYKMLNERNANKNESHYLHLYGKPQA